MKNVMTETEEKAFYRKVYDKGKADGELRAKQEITIQLENEYYGNGYPHSWFGPVNWLRRDRRLKIFMTNLWELYGPTYEDGDDI